MEVEEGIMNETRLEFEALASFKPSFLFFLEEIFIFLCALVGIVLNLTVVFLVVKFKKMRTRLNVLICNVCINNVFLFLTNSETILLLDVMLDIDFSISCYLFDLLCTFLAVSGTFMFMISLNSVFKLPTKWFRVLIFGVWSVVIVTAISNTILCSFDSYFYFGIDFFVFMFSNAMVLIRFCIYVKDVFQKNVSKEERFRQGLCALYVFPLLLTTLTLIFSALFWFDLWMFLIGIMLQVCYCLPIFEVVFLIMRDGNYKMCFANLMNCKYNYIEAAITYKTGSDDENHLTNEDLETGGDLETSA